MVYTATVTPEAGAGLPATGGVITFTLDKGTVNAFTENVPVIGGVATFDPQGASGNNFTWPLGTHTIDATFTDTNNPPSFTPASAATVTQTVTQGPTTVGVTLVNPTATPVYGQTVTLTASVAAVVPPTTTGSILPTGSLTFTIDPGPSQIVLPVMVLNSLDQASAALPNTLSVGPHLVQVVYSGDTNYAGTTIASDFLVTVLQDTTAVNVTSSPPGSAILGQPVTFTATVVPSLAGSPGQPSGTVTFYDGAAVAANQIGATQAQSTARRR